ncbi:MAG: tetratricopeptide repeat protein [Kiritimatiellia bacterium]
MKPVSLHLLLLAASALTLAQQPQSILNQIPYRPDPSDQPVNIPLLDTNHILLDLEPLPAFEIPAQVPPEFQYTREQQALLRKFQEAHQLLQQGKAESAVEIFKQTLALNPEELNIHVALADSYYAAGAYTKAVEHYQFVLNRDPLHFQSLNNLAWLLSSVDNPELRNLEQARVLGERARLIRPNSHHVWSTLAQVYMHTDKYAEAEQAITNALTIAQQTRVSLKVVVNYLLQRDRARVAHEATSILE